MEFTWSSDMPGQRDMISSLEGIARASLGWITRLSFLRKTERIVENKAVSSRRSANTWSETSFVFMIFSQLSRSSASSHNTKDVRHTRRADKHVAKQSLLRHLYEPQAESRLDNQQKRWSSRRKSATDRIGQYEMYARWIILYGCCIILQG